MQQDFDMKDMLQKLIERKAKRLIELNKNMVEIHTNFNCFANDLHAKFETKLYKEHLPQINPWEHFLESAKQILRSFVM